MSKPKIKKHDLIKYSFEINKFGVLFCNPLVLNNCKKWGARNCKDNAVSDEYARFHISSPVFSGVGPSVEEFVSVLF
jgi:hypothetical protein